MPLVMLLFAAAALSATAPVETRPGPVVAQATATVRIVAGVRLKLDAPRNPNAPPAHDAKVTTADGVKRPARLIEFE